MATDVLQEFLVELGWSVNKEGQKRFTDAVAGAKKSALGLAAALAAVGAAVVSTADAYSRMGYEARNANSSVGGMQSLVYAMKQMGGSADGVRSSLQSMANFVRFGGPGAENVFRHLGIATRDSKNNLRDMSDILEDFFSRARQMPQYQAKAYADLLGIDSNTLIAGEADPGMLNRQREQYYDIYRRLGLDPNKAAAESQRMMQQLNRLVLAIQATGEKVTLSLIHAFGGKDLDSLTNYLLSHSDEIASAIKSMMDIVIQFTRTVISAAKEVNSLVEGTVGWKNALLAVFGLFAASKIVPIVAGLGQILLMMTRIGKAKELLQSGKSIQEGVAAGEAAASSGASATVGTAASAATTGASEGFVATAGAAGAPLAMGAGALGSAYVGYEGLSLLHDMWKRAHPDTPKELVDRQNVAMNYFQSVGLTKEQAAGIVGNLTRESGVGDPNAKPGDNGHAFGVAEWHGERAHQIYRDFSIDVTHAPLVQQLQAVYLEATQGEDPQARKAWYLIQHAKSAAESAYYFRKYFERPKDADGQEDVKRTGYADQILDRSPVAELHGYVKKVGEALNRAPEKVPSAPTVDTPSTSPVENLHGYVRKLGETLNRPAADNTSRSPMDELHGYMQKVGAALNRPAADNPPNVSTVHADNPPASPVDNLHGYVRKLGEALNRPAADDASASPAEELQGYVKKLGALQNRPLGSTTNTTNVQNDASNNAVTHNVSSSPSQTNHIEITVEGTKSSPSDIANAVTAGINKSWNDMLMSNVPRRQGLLGTS